MATKPNTLPQNWASNNLYINGPFIGDVQKADPGPIAAAGHRPGKDFPTAAEHENFQQFQITKWIRDWLALGNSTNEQSTHIVETDATGRATVHGFTINNTTGQSALFITATGALGPSVTINNAAGGNGVVVNLSGSTGTAFNSTLTGQSTGLRLLMNGMNGVQGQGISITGNGTTTKDAVVVSMQSTARCLNLTSLNGDTIQASSQGSGTAVSAFSTAGTAIQGNTVIGPQAASFSALNNGDGILVNSDQGFGARIQTQGGPGIQVDTIDNGIAIRTKSTSADSGYFESNQGNGITALTGTGIGVWGRSSSNDGGRFESNTGVGVRVSSPNNTGVLVTTNAALARGIVVSTGAAAGIDVTSNSSVGAVLKSNTNYAATLQGDLFAPTNGAMRVFGQDSRPSNLEAGQFTYNSDERQWLVTNEGAAGFRGVWTTTGGFAAGRYFDASENIVDAGIGFVIAATLITTADNSPKVANRRIVVRVNFDVRVLTPGSNCTIGYRFRDGNQGDLTVYGPYNTVRNNTDTFYRGDVSFTAHLTPSVVGPTAYKLELSATLVSFALRNLSIEFVGTI